MKLIIALLLLIGATRVRAGELLDKVVAREIDSIASTSKPREPEQILAVGLERTTHHLNERPAYCVIFHRDRRVTYEGIKNVERIGKYEGYFSPQIFDRLADYVLKSGFFDLPGFFRRQTSDATAYVLCVRTEKGEKLVWDPNFPEYSNSTVWAVGELIDGLLSKTKLKKVKKSEEEKPTKQRTCTRE